MVYNYGALKAADPVPSKLRFKPTCLAKIKVRWENTNTFPFLDLPSEIRLRIFECLAPGELIFFPNKKIFMSRYSSRMTDAPKGSMSSFIEALHINKQIRGEILHFITTTKTICFTVDQAYGLLSVFGSRHLGEIRKAIIDAHDREKQSYEVDFAENLSNLLPHLTGLKQLTFGLEHSDIPGHGTSMLLLSLTSNRTAGYIDKPLDSAAQLLKLDYVVALQRPEA